MSRRSNRFFPRGFSRRMAGVGATALLAASVLAGCGGGQGAGKTLTVWQNGDMDGGFAFMHDVAKEFEKENPGVKINFVEKPQDNFFALVKTSFISRNGPDIVHIYPGTYMAPIQDYLLDLNQYVPASVRNSLPGVEYYSKDADTNKGTFGLPPMDQFFNMWFNKDLFAQAGIQKPPTTFDEMKHDCGLLRAKGITPLADGSPSFVAPGSGATQDWSYLASVYSPSQWNDILDGRIPYDSPELVNQVAQWSSLFAAGCTSNDVTTENGADLFSKGKVAMMNSYSGYYGDFSKALGDKLGAMIPPWSVTPQKTISQMPGAGYSVNKDSKNAELASKFVAFIVSEPAQKILADSGGMPILPTVPANGQPLRDLQAMARSGDYTLYPFFDNYMPSQVVAQINTALPQAFIGRISAAEALGSFQKAYDSIPASERSVDFHLGK